MSHTSLVIQCVIVKGNDDVKKGAVPMISCEHVPNQSDRDIGANVFCKDGCLKVHSASPFHRLFQWTGAHYAPTSLYSLGLVLFLGHQGKPCPSIVEVRFLKSVYLVTCTHMYARVPWQCSYLLQ